MYHTWQLHEAKNKLNEIIAATIKNGPQTITDNEIETVILISYAEYSKLLTQQQKLSSFFRESPLVDADINLARDKSKLINEMVL